MKRAALGVRMHSGWGVLVAVCGASDSLEVIERRRIVVIDPTMPGAKQPYHYAAQRPTSRVRDGEGGQPLRLRSGQAWGAVPTKMGHSTDLEPTSGDARSAREFSEQRLAEAERYLADCAGVSERLALAAVGEVVRELEGRGYGIVGCAVLSGAGRPLPGLGKILAAHPLIHTAEGEFFRNAVRKACEGLRISVVRIPEREVEERALAAFGNAAGGVEGRIARMGKAIGPPWTKDHKTAALAALVVLGGGSL
jgi:hypothetical protein